MEKVGNKEEAKKKEFLFYCLTLEDGIDRLSRNFGNMTAILHCIKSQKSADLNKELFCSLVLIGTGPLVFSSAVLNILVGT